MIGGHVSGDREKKPQCCAPELKVLGHDQFKSNQSPLNYHLVATDRRRGRLASLRVVMVKRAARQGRPLLEAASELQSMSPRLIGRHNSEQQIRYHFRRRPACGHNA